MIGASQKHFRQRQKTDMLFHPNWRERVIAELGGWKRLARWTKRQAAIEAASAHHRAKAYQTVIHPVSVEEVARRAWMRDLMNANVHPRILHDPCRMDFDGWFRLPPQTRLTNPIADPDYEYDFDPTRRADFTGVSAPIMVWPEEFTAAAELRPFIEERGRHEAIEQVVTVSPRLSHGPQYDAVGEIFFAIFMIFSLLLEQVFSRGRLPFFHVRAPPRIRGSPIFIRRQIRFGGRFSLACQTQPLTNTVN